MEVGRDVGTSVGWAVGLKVPLGLFVGPPVGPVVGEAGRIVRSPSSELEDSFGDGPLDEDDLGILELVVDFGSLLLPSVSLWMPQLPLRDVALILQVQ